MMNRACMVMPMTGRTPHGVRGLKFGPAQVGDGVGLSHPSRGAWIEIISKRAAYVRWASRTPHGVRGLKSIVARRYPRNRLSHPSRGAWIEIYIDVVGHVIAAESHPSRGAWIEIIKCTWIRYRAMVAPLTGCVD